MSTLKVNTVQHNTTGFNNVVQFTDGAGTENGQLARAWVNFDGTGTVAIRADFNVNTIGDNGTADYTVNFSNSMSDANYAVVASSPTSPSSIDQAVLTFGVRCNTGVYGTPTSKTTSGVRVQGSYAYYNGYGEVDMEECNIAIFR